MIFSTKMLPRPKVKTIKMTLARPRLSLKLAMKCLAGLYILVQICVFLYFVIPLDQLHHPEISFASFFRKKIIQVDNSSIFYKFPIVDCKAIEEDKYTEEYAMKLFDLEYNPTEESLDQELDDCEMYFLKRKRIRGVLNSVTPKELENPLAFSIGTHSDAVMFERLFSAIYRSHNYYCIHIDLKAKYKFFRIIEKLTRCYNSQYKTGNVFLTDDRVSVYWAHWTMVQADLNCMRDLLVRNTSMTPWKWYVNMAGTEFPLMSNKEIVDRITSAPTELVGSIPLAEEFRYRHHFTQYLSLEKDKVYNGPIPTGIKKPALPYGLQIYKGSKNMAVSRAFVDFVTYSEISWQLKLWFSDTWAPDEHYIPTLVRVSVDSQRHVIQDTDPHKYKSVEGMGAPELIIRFTVFEEGIPDGWLCGGRWQRWLCVFGFINLPELIANQQQHLVANKFDLWMDAVVVQCLEEHLVHEGRGSPRNAIATEVKGDSKEGSFKSKLKEWVKGYDPREVYFYAERSGGKS